jgi:hypothetical protein
MALIDMMQLWHEAIHRNQSVRIIFIDYTKAFDLIDHGILIEKFRKLGTPQILLSWLEGYLSERQQRVKLGQEVSEWITLKGAMPQGSWLGPLCFIVYLHDMPTPDSTKIHKYIDDSTISEILTKGEESKSQQAIQNIEEWSTENKMIINESKTKEMIIHMRKTPLNTEPIIVNDKPIERIDNFKLLGIWISSNLTWNYHIDRICTKASQRIYFLKLLRRSGAPTKDLITYYKTIVRPIIEYGCQVWSSGLTVEQSQKLESQQKRSINIILPGTDYNTALNTLKIRDTC